ncbi:MAG: cobalamin biosynthesis protein [Spirochaetales bacterium]|nr:cobalamin biosynthesis protein [Spirochaetales bacterium]
MGKVKPIGGAMERVKGPIAFVVLNEDSADLLSRALASDSWCAAEGDDPGRDRLRSADIINMAHEKISLKEKAADLFRDYDGLIFVMASGIVWRVLAPHVHSKYEDPAVVILDGQWRHGVSALSGHEGGANWLTYQVARLTGAEPVISTGTESGKSLILGIGCRRDTEDGVIEEAVGRFLSEQDLTVFDIRLAATVDLKKTEGGLIRAMDRLGIPLVFFSGERINSLDDDFTRSEAAMRQLGIKGVSEPCALLAGRNSRIIQEKTVQGPVTLALSREEIWKR